MSSFVTIKPLEANLRRQPVLSPDAIITQLKQGERVEKLPPLAGQPTTWQRVRALVRGSAVEGYIKSALLQPTEQRAAGHDALPPDAPLIPTAHLPLSRPVRPGNPDLRAHPLNDPQQPTRTGDSAPARVAALGRIIDYLQVEQQARYRRTATTTFCNIYAHDYCHLAGAYLPRVWWLPKALALAKQGQVPKPQYGITVSEYNVNALFNWLEEFGQHFGWKPVSSLTELQQAANEGKVCLIVAQHTNAGSPGHVAAVVPETAHHRATRQGQQVTVPLQSQAGATNYSYGGTVWWRGARYQRSGYWVHA